MPFLEFLVTSRRVISFGGWGRPHVGDEAPLEDIRALHLTPGPMGFGGEVAIYLASSDSPRRLLVPDPGGLRTAIWDASLAQRSDGSGLLTSSEMSGTHWVLLG